MEGDHSSTILHSPNPIDQSPSYLSPLFTNPYFPCLPARPNPNRSPPTAPPNPNPQPPSPKSVAEPSAPSPNVWKNKPPHSRQILNKKFFLRFIPPSARDSSLVGLCSSEAVAGELQILDLTLVGFFLGRKPGFSFVRTNLLKQWKLRGSVQILQLTQGGLAVRFSDLEDRDQILETGVYYVGGQPIFFRSWERNIHTGGILGLKQIPLWVYLPGLPLHLWGVDSLSAICSVLGKPLYSDRITAEKSRWSYARACVEFSGASPLLDSITIEDDVGNIFQQPVKYDWKPRQCLSCGTFGHSTDSCMRGPGTAEQACKKDPTPSNQKLFKQKNPSLPQATEETNLATAPEMRNDARTDHSYLGKGKTFSELLRKRPSVLLRGWNPIRVKKTGPGTLDPTRNRTSSQPVGQKADKKLLSDHVLICGETDGGPSYFMEKETQSNPLSSLPCLDKISKFKLDANSSPPLTNRFGILELEEGTSPCPHMDERSLSDSSSNQGLVQKEGSTLLSFDQPCEGLCWKEPGPRHSGEPLPLVGPGPGKVGRSDLGQVKENSPLLGLGDTLGDGWPRNQTKHSNSYSSPCPPKPSTPPPSNETEYSSAGRTPFHPRFSNPISPFKTNTELTKHSRNMVLLAPYGADKNQRIDPTPERIDEGHGTSMPESHLHFADATAEDVQENIEEEEADLEEDENEDPSEKDVIMIGREKEEEDAAIRRRSLQVAKNDARWVTTTNRNDPRMIGIC